MRIYKDKSKRENRGEGKGIYYNTSTSPENELIL